MSEQTGKIQTPRGVARMLYRIPILLYRFHLGCFLDIQDSMGYSIID
jgi:hypothetical protein